MKTLVTGGAGFIGSHLAQLLLEEGHEVIVVDNLCSGCLSNLEAVKGQMGFCFEKQDILHLDFSLFEGVDWVFHLAGLADIVPSIEHPVQYFEVNVQGTLNVLECAKKASVSKLIYAASSSCYGIPKIYPTAETTETSPQYPYALTKYLAEQLVLHWEQVYGIAALSLRLFNVFGPRSRTAGAYGAVFGVFLAQKLHGNPFTVVGDGTQTRDFTFVTDVANAFYRAAQSSFSGEIFNVGSGDHNSINRLVELLEGDVVYIPKRPGEPDCTFADISKIQKKLGWKPQISFEEGVEKVLAAIDDYRDAPIWDSTSIAKATEVWFNQLDCTYVL